MKSVEFPVPGCMSMAHSAGRMWEHFMYRNFRLKYTLMQEGSDPLPRCNMRIMHIPRGNLIKHWRTVHCFKNIEMRQSQNYLLVTNSCTGM